MPATQIIPYHQLHDAIAQKPLFDSKHWLLSPMPFSLSRDQVDELHRIGNACYEFYNALERLYRKSSLNEPILRNNNTLKAEWVAEYFNRGKPQHLITHNLHPSTHHQTPFIIRPDLLLTSNGFALTELDAVPGGVGFTAFLNAFYKHAGFTDIIGEKTHSMTHTFFESITHLTHSKNIPTPTIAIVVSEEAQTYLPEFEWLTHQLHTHHKNIYCIKPSDLHFNPDHSIYIKDQNSTHIRIDILYRFFELFDLPNIPHSEKIIRAVEEGQVILTPPMRTFQEEKMSFAFFHDPELQPFWEEQLTKDNLTLLRKIIPKTWIIDQLNLPHGAYIDGPTLSGKPIHNWMDLAKAGQKERNFILKISGFSPLSWGARSVTIGTDVPQDRWQQALQTALHSAPQNPYVIQKFHKPMIMKHLIYKTPETCIEMAGRVRICPYYFIDQAKKATMIGGILATICPADKKIIHGMSEAALIPCRMDERSSQHGQER
jgi:hypothetical protein